MNGLVRVTGRGHRKSCVTRFHQRRRETKGSRAVSRWPGDMVYGFRLSEER